MRRSISSRRLAMLLALAVGILTLGLPASAQQKGTREQRDPQNSTNPPSLKVRPAAAQDAHKEMFDTCAKACDECKRICDACARHCVMQVAEGKKEHLRTVQTCQDCASFCATASCIMARQGPFAGLICQGCAEACNRCGKECERFNDPMMKDCARECRECEKACREMLKHVNQQVQETPR